LIARSAKSLDLLPASALERLFWDVDAWAGAIPADHPNAVPALALAQGVKAEYRRRNQETPLVAAQRLAIQVMEELLGGIQPRAKRAVPSRLTLLPGDDSA